MNKELPKKELDEFSHTERVVLVHIKLASYNSESWEDEFIELADSAGATSVAMIYAKRVVPCSKTFIGSGIVSEVAHAVEETDATLVIFNCQLTPSQETNLEKALQCRVVDRTGLILDIFAKRARTYEGKLQVELAQLQHISTRLIRGWTHLERQKGGIGLRGPGESQLETDRRLLRERIKHINKLLAKVRKQRKQSRKARSQSSTPIVSLVGYTNAGKSTLFNVLSNSDIFVADKLFATLDPTVRKVDLPFGKKMIITDTVGFIRNLPHELVQAFRSTLEEIRESSLLLHVVNVTWDNKEDIVEEVNKVLKEIGAIQVPQLLVFNQIDKLDFKSFKSEIDSNVAVWISAKTLDGVDILKKAIVEYLYGEAVFRSIKLDAWQSKIRAELYNRGVVKNEHINDLGESIISVKMTQADFDNLESELAEEHNSF